MSFVGGRGGIFLNKSLIFWACSFIFLTQRFHNKFYIFFGTDLSSISKLNRQQLSVKINKFLIFFFETRDCLAYLAYLAFLTYLAYLLTVEALITILTIENLNS